MSQRMRIPLAVVACLFLSSCANPHSDDVDDGSMKPTMKPMTEPRKSFKYMVQGPWNIGDPVHETLTLLSIRTAIEQHKSKGNLLAGVALSKLPSWNSKTDHTRTAGASDKSLHQFLRGVIWPDDPEGLFFNNKKDVYNFSTGLGWGAALKKDPSKPENITARSHHGDLQYFHSMSPDASMPRQDVRKKMLQWAGFLVDVSAGKIKPGTALSTIGPIAELFPNRSTVSDLFVADSSAADLYVRQRAVGALLHMVQDSHSHGHAKRSSDGGIVSFHCYSDPDHDRNEHALKDVWAPGATLKQRVDNTDGAADAVRKGSGLLALINAGKPRAEIMRFIEAEVFNLAAGSP